MNLFGLEVDTETRAEIIAQALRWAVAGASGGALALNIGNPVQLFGATFVVVLFGIVSETAIQWLEAQAQQES
jgi:hypothetical protein